jgi:hypothetical protein
MARRVRPAHSRPRRALLRPAAALASIVVAGASRAGAQQAPSGRGAAASSPVNAVETVVSDMRLRNDLPLRGYEGRTVGWYVGPGIVQLGNDPRMTNAPRWFKQSHPTFVSDTYMRAFLPWVVIFDGAGHAAVNTRVELRNMRAFHKSRATGAWRQIGHSPGLSGYATPKSTLLSGTVAEDKRTRPGGSVEIKPPADPKYAWHGWWDRGRVAIDPQDLAAVFVTVQARLVPDDPALPDDRASARLLLQVGADYYYDEKWRWTVGAPGVGTSRSKLVKNDWQAFNLFTFSDVGEQDPGGGISEAEFRRAPPPLE